MDRAEHYFIGGNIKDAIYANNITFAKLSQRKDK